MNLLPDVLHGSSAWRQIRSNLRGGRSPPQLSPRRHARSVDEARSMRNDRIEVHPVAGALGAEILNVDLAHDLGEETIGAIRRAWLEHLVVFFRDQTLEPEL